MRPMAFKMSLVLGKVSKVMSCEIRAQAKKRRHVSHFKFIRNNICSVDLFISIFYGRIKPAGRPERGRHPRACCTLRRVALL